MKSYGSATPHQNGDATRKNHLSGRTSTQIDFLMGSPWVRSDGLDVVIFDDFNHFLHMSREVRPCSTSSPSGNLVGGLPLVAHTGEDAMGPEPPP